MIVLIEKIHIKNMIKIIVLAVITVINNDNSFKIKNIIHHWIWIQKKINSHIVNKINNNKSRLNLQ